MDKVAVVILNWNGVRWLQQFLDSVTTYSSPHTIYIIDNQSTDESVAYIQLYYPEVVVIQLDKNYGFASGYNIGLKKINAEYFILLNSDVQVTKDWIDPVIQQMDRNSKIAAVQPKILDFNDYNMFEYAGAAGGYIDKYGVPFCRGRIFGSVETDSGQYDETTKIFWASGAALFVRSKAFSEVGGFDEDFFAHMEEIDLCWRLQNVGYEIYCNPLSKVYHFGGGTLNKVNPKKYFLNFRNSLWMLLKNLPLGKLFQTLFIRMLLDGIAAIKMAISGRPIMLWVVLHAHLVFYFTIGKTLKKRNHQHRQCIPNTVYTRSIVGSYYFFKKKHFSDLGIR